MKYIKNILLIILLLGFTKINEVKGATMETSFTCTYTSAYGDNQYVEYGIDYDSYHDNAKYWYLKNEYDHSVKAEQKYADSINTLYGFTLFYKGNPPQNALLNQTINVSFTYANSYLQDAFDRYESYFANYENYEPFKASDFCPKTSIEKGTNGTYKVVYGENKFVPNKNSGSSTSQSGPYEININNNIEDKYNLSLILEKANTSYNIKARLQLVDQNWTSSRGVNVNLNQSSAIELTVSTENDRYTFKIQPTVIQNILKSIENGSYKSAYFRTCSPDINVYYVVASTNDAVCQRYTSNNEEKNNGEHYELGNKEPVDCDSLLGDPEDKKYPAYWMQMSLDIMKYVAIIALLVLSTMDFLKASVQNDKDALKKATITTVKRFIYAVLIFFLPIVINVLMKLLGAYGTCGLG